MTKHTISLAVLILMLQGCNNESISPDETPITPLFLSFVNQDQKDLFNSSDYNAESISLSYGDRSVFDRGIMFIEERDSFKVFQIIGWHNGMDAYIDFGNGDIDTLKISTFPVSNDIRSDLLSNKLDSIKVYYNTELIKTWDVTSGSEDRVYLTSYFDLTESVLTGPFPEVFIIRKE